MVKEICVLCVELDISKIQFSSSSLGHLKMEVRPWKRDRFWKPSPLGVESIVDNGVYYEHLS